MAQELTKQLMVRVSDEDHADLKAIADAEDRDVSYVARRAVRAEIERCRKNAKRRQRKELTPGAPQSFGEALSRGASS